MIRVNNLVKRYKELVAIDHFNLELESGKLLGLLGPNGSGKTTFVNCTVGLLKYDEGEITIFDEQMKPNAYKLKSRIGMIPQKPAVFDALTVYENIDFFWGLYVNDAKERKQLVNEAIEFVELEKFKKFFPKKLSGGLLRRLNIACGIAHKPELIFFDEPTVGVDAQSRNFILDGIKELNKNGSTIIYTTHYLDEVEYIADQITIIDSGKNLISGSVDEVKNLSKTSEKISIEFAETDQEDYTELFKNIEHLNSCEKNENKYLLKFSKVDSNVHGKSKVENVLKVLQSNDINYLSFTVEKPTLNDVFLDLTGKELRD